VCIRGEPSVSGDRPIGSYQEENMPGSRSLIDDELAEALKAVLMNRKRLFDLTDIPAARKAQRSFAESVAATLPDDPSVTVRELRVPRAGGPAVLVRLLRPADAPGPLPVMVWFHGGGQVVGFAAQDDPRLTRMCLALGCAIASVDYRLAPETPAPGAAEDGYTAYQFITREAGALGLDRTRTGLAGVSGGGAIAAATALLIRDRGAAAPLFQSLTFPMLDDRNATRSSREITDSGTPARLRRPGRAAPVSRGVSLIQRVRPQLTARGELRPYLAQLPRPPLRSGMRTRALLKGTQHGCHPPNGRTTSQ
jgi:acetyl esterase/lipase